MVWNHFQKILQFYHIFFCFVISASLAGIRALFMEDGVSTHRGCMARVVAMAYLYVPTSILFMISAILWIAAIYKIFKRSEFVDSTDTRFVFIQNILSILVQLIAIIFQLISSIYDQQNYIMVAWCRLVGFGSLGLISFFMLCCTPYNLRMSRKFWRIFVGIRSSYLNLTTYGARTRATSSGSTSFFVD